jgi:hypothetical protein
MMKESSMLYISWLEEQLSVLMCGCCMMKQTWIPEVTFVPALYSIFHVQGEFQLDKRNNHDDDDSWITASLSVIRCARISCRLWRFMDQS